MRDATHSEVHSGACVIPFKQLDWVRLAEILVLGGYRVSREEEGLLVRTELATLVFAIDEELEVLIFVAVFSFDPAASPEACRVMVQRLNARAMVVRFHVGEEASLFIEYNLPLSAGVTAAQVLAAVGLFVDAAREDLEACGAGEVLA